MNIHQTLSATTGNAGTVTTGNAGTVTGIVTWYGVTVIEGDDGGTAGVREPRAPTRHR